MPEGAKIMRFLITGARGQLAEEFQRFLKDEEVIAFTKEMLDISDADAIASAVSSISPDIILNCAAYNFVDKAEDDFDASVKINADGVKNLAIASKKYNALLVHYSTDYVFDGMQECLYAEADKTNPINNYGKSKLMGEMFLKSETENYLLFRVSWVFGEGKQNFLYKLSEWAEENRLLKIVCDQISTPTYTEDIVKYTVLAINKGVRGTYHLTNSGYASRYEVSKYYLSKLGWNGLALPVSSNYFSTPAKRPYFSAMSNKKLSDELGVKMPHWTDGIDRFLERIK